MRPLSLAAPVALLLLLSACAPAMGSSRYTEDLETLSAQCGARGGILVPTGQESGRPQADYACRITGGATRLPIDG